MRTARARSMAAAVLGSLLVAGVASGQSGACCAPTGACTVVDAEECGFLSFFVGWTCAPSPCHPPVHYCCLPDGSCELQGECRCVARGGVWDVADRCDCPAIESFGACCTGAEPDGGCFVGRPEACAAGGGLFHAGVTCAAAGCDGGFILACCCANQECVVTAAEACRSAGGRALTRSACAVLFCLPSRLGACCVPPAGAGGPARCLLREAGSCAVVRGVFAGIGAACDTPEGSGNLTTCCAANFNREGGVTVQDVFDYLAAYFAGDAGAEMDRSPGIGVGDLFVFLRLYFVGCGY